MMLDVPGLEREGRSGPGRHLPVRLHLQWQ